VLREIATTYRDRGLAIIGIEVQETVEDGRRYVQRYGLPYSIGADVVSARWSTGRSPREPRTR
jgi:hypothetical protein